MVLVGNRLVPRHAVAVAEQDHAVLILDRGDTPVAVPVDRFDRLPEVTLPVPAATSAAGRLWAAIRARAAGAFRARWSDAAVDSAAVDAATISLGTRRSAALDLVTLGLAPRPELGLSRFETAWYQARGEAFDPKGDPAALIRLLRELPAGGYPDRVRLLMPWLGTLCADGRLRGSASELVEPFAANDADARALLAALAPAPQQNVEEILGAYVREAGTRAEAAVVQQIVEGGPLPGGVYGPALAELNRYSTALASCRADPGAASEEELATADFVAEQARRAYLAGDRDALAADGDRRAPAGEHEATRHYRALLAYVTGDPFEYGDLRSEARAVIAQLDEPARAAAEVAADRSAWPKLWRAATEGTLVADDQLRARYPGFGHWVDLGTVYRSLRDGHWAAAAAAADAIAAEVLAAESSAAEASGAEASGAEASAAGVGAAGRRGARCRWARARCPRGGSDRHGKR